jgi:hypothetical protein
VCFREAISISLPNCDKNDDVEIDSALPFGEGHEMEIPAS